MSLVHRARALGQAGLDTVGERLSIRGAGIRAKVTWAFGVVALLLLPQIALTVFYLLSLFQHGDRVVHLGNAVRDVARVTARAEDLLPERAPRTPPGLTQTLADIDRVSEALRTTAARMEFMVAATPAMAGPVGDLRQARDRLTALATLVRGAGQRATQAPPPETPGLQTVAGALADLADRLTTWSELAASGAPTPPAERAAWLEDFGVRVLAYLTGELLAGQLEALTAPPPFEQDDLRISRAKRDLLDTLARAETALTAGGAAAGTAIREDVDEANRFLVTLVLITLVYLAVIAVVLPGRLVRPLEHVRSVMARAGRGRLDVRARVAGDDEIAAVSASLNELLERLEAFDALKRDRIALDRRRVDALVQGLPSPVAVLDSRQRVEVANDAFRRWFGLGSRDDGRPLADALRPDEGAQALTEALDRALLSGHPTEGLHVELTGGDEVRGGSLSATVGHDRAGRTAFVILRITPDPVAPTPEAREPAPEEHRSQPLARKST